MIEKLETTSKQDRNAVARHPTDRHSLLNRATAKAKQVLARYEAPPLDPAIDEALLAFINKRKAELPNNVT